MAFNPFTERGTPIEKQWEPVAKVVTDAHDKDKIDEFSRLRFIAAYGVETEQWYFYHAMARHTDDDNLKLLLAEIRRAEDQHRSEATFFTDPTSTFLELTIAIEHLAVALTAAAAKDEPDPYVRQVFDYGLLEDYDHLFRFSLALERFDHKNANDITRRVVEIKPGRPTWEEPLHPADTLRNFYDAGKADPLTKLHAHAILAAEQQTRQYYVGHAFYVRDRELRQLYAEIGQIEEQHVSQYESIIDPRTSWLEMAIDHEYSEIYTYYGFIQKETQPEMKHVWEEHLSHELEHLRLWNEMYNRLEGKDARQLWPEELPKPIALGDAKLVEDYVNQVLASQLDLRALGKTFVHKRDLPPDWPSQRYQQEVQANQMPSLDFQSPRGPAMGGLRM